jgi:hypothetical protein
MLDKPRIAIDAFPLAGRITGIGRYVLEICRALDVLMPEAEFLLYSPQPLAVGPPSSRWRVRVAGSNRASSYVWLKRRAGAMARALEKRLPFATHPAYGYLSANPDNLGTGLRLYCTFSFFGLFLNKELDAVLRGIERLGLNVYPLYLLSEKEDNPLEAPGCCYVVASTQTMGRESDIIEGMEHVCEELEIAETNARLRLVDSRMPMLVDFLTRSVAVGSTAVQMTESEGLDIAHAILLGIDFGLLELSGDDQEMALNAPTLMTHAALSQIVPPEAETKSAVKDAPVQPMLIPEVGEGDGGGDDEAADGAAEFAGLRNSRAFLMRQLAIKLLPQCLEKLGYKAVVKEIRSRR